MVDEEPLLFHTGPRRMFPLVREAVAAVMPVERLRYVAFSHVEADECGSLNELLAVAPQAAPLCGQIAAMVSVNDVADRPPRALADGEILVLGRQRVRWLDTPHVPHGWECGYLFEETTRTLFCGDLFTQPGAEHAALTTGDILGPSEAMRSGDGLLRPHEDTRGHLERLAATPARRRSPACTAARGRGMADGCSWTSPTCFHHLQITDLIEVDGACARDHLFPETPGEGRRRPFESPREEATCAR